MNHQTYEEWALMPEYLSPEEQQALAQHQKECETCRLLAANWKVIEEVLTSSKPVSPAPGFATRFAASMESRKAKEHKRQVRKFMLILSLIFIITMTAISIFYYSTHSPVAIIESVFHTGARLVTLWESVKTVAISMSNIAPPAFTIPFLSVAGIVVGGMTLVWVATLWKFSFAGGKRK